MSSEDFELHEAIKHMNKLDRILKKKLKLEREVWWAGCFVVVFQFCHLKLFPVVSIFAQENICV